MELFVILLMFIIVLEGIFFSTIKNNSSKRANIVFAIILFLQFFIPAGLRNISVYNDSISYYDHFTEIRPEFIFDINPLERFEPAYQLLENIIYFTLSHETIYLFFVTSLIIQISYIIFFFKYSKVLWFSAFLYFGLTHYFFVVSGIRQGLAISIFNFAIPFLFARKWFYYCLIVILAAQFHSSAYLLIFLPFINYVKLNRKTLIISIIVIVINFLFLDKIFDMFFSFFPNYGVDYLEKERISESKVGLYIILITYLIGLYFVIKNFSLKNYTTLQKFMLMFYLIMIMFLFLAIKVSILVRYIHYFTPLSIVLLSNSVAAIKKPINRFISYMFWVLLLSTQIYIILAYREDWFMVLPFKFYWE